MKLSAPRSVIRREIIECQGITMSSTKREQARIERQLIASLTDACETAKSEITGFCWLTHTVDYQRFPESLQVTWVFDSQAHKELAHANGQNARMVELTAIALEDADVQLSPLAAHVHVDSEEECQRSHGGDWQRRLSRFKATKR